MELAGLPDKTFVNENFEYAKRSWAARSGLTLRPALRKAGVTTTAVVVVVAVAAVCL